MTFVVPCEYPAPPPARANELAETWLLAVLVMCIDDPDQDEELEPLFMANLPALRDDNRRIWEWGKIYTLPHSRSNGSCARRSLEIRRLLNFLLPYFGTRFESRFWGVDVPTSSASDWTS